MTASRLRGLYAITDETLIPEAGFAATVELALKGGTALVQYRDKSGDQGKRLQQASELRELCNAYSATLIINDDIALAQAVAADGVHVGEDDAAMPLLAFPVITNCSVPSMHRQPAPIMLLSAPCSARLPSRMRARRVIS